MAVQTERTSQPTRLTDGMTLAEMLKPELNTRIPLSHSPVASATEGLELMRVLDELELMGPKQKPNLGR